MLKQKPSYKITTLGCKVNQYESEKTARELGSWGLIPTDNQAADIFVINTCSVTSTSDRKSRKLIHQAKKANPDAMVVVTGCYAENAEEIIAAMPEVDLVVTNQNKEQLPALIAKQLGLAVRVKQKIPDYSPRIRAFLKIQDGCDAFCSYCVIPYLRGAPRSREFSDIKEEARLFLAMGIKEIVLTGIHLGKFGIDNGLELADLILELNALGFERIRLSSLESGEIDDRLADALSKHVSKHPSLTPHLHLPLQSGSDEILKKMNRTYSAEQFLSRVLALKNKIDGLAITSDVIAGFPGETEDDFKKTIDICEKARFSRLHVFAFSPRPPAPAADLPDQIQESIKKERVARLLDLSEELEDRAIKDRLASGRHSFKILIERKLGKDLSEGLSEDYYRFRFKSSGAVGDIREVSFQEKRQGYIWGKEINE